jgi:hypothetical protein
VEGSQVAVAVAIGMVIFLAVMAANRSRQSGGGDSPAAASARSDDGGVVPVTAIGLTGSARGGGMVDDEGRPGHSHNEAPDAGDSGRGASGGDGGGGRGGD